MKRRRAEGRLIARRLELPPLPRVYALFRELRRARVDNRRTRAIRRDRLAARPDPAFDAVKYRGAMKDAVRHAHLRPDREEGGELRPGCGHRDRVSRRLRRGTYVTTPRWENGSCR